MRAAAKLTVKLRLIEHGTERDLRPKEELGGELPLFCFLFFSILIFLQLAITLLKVTQLLVPKPSGVSIVCSIMEKRKK